MVEQLNWQQTIGVERQKNYFRELTAFVEAERRAAKIIYPVPGDVFNAFRYTSFAEVKVVILGQDPYHGPHQAHGLCFSVPDKVAHPPSLVNIYRELEEDIPDFKRPCSGCLEPWAKQGVLLLNAVLTVEAGRAHSHANIGWERFSDQVIAALNQHREGIIFLLWGNYAQKKGAIIDSGRHFILTAAHPSPLSAYRGFFGCRHFSRTNQLLAAAGRDPIVW